jgi:hypothetical protein
MIDSLLIYRPCKRHHSNPHLKTEQINTDLTLTSWTCRSRARDRGSMRFECYYKFHSPQHRLYDSQSGHKRTRLPQPGHHANNLTRIEYNNHATSEYEQVRDPRYLPPKKPHALRRRRRSGSGGIWAASEEADGGSGRDGFGDQDAQALVGLVAAATTARAVIRAPAAGGGRCAGRRGGEQ